MAMSLSFKGLTCNALDRLLPDNVKRLIFISSVTGFLQEVQTPETVLAEKLNQLMNVCNRSNSMLLPIMLNSTIWNNFDPSIMLKQKGIDYTDIIKFDDDNKASMKDLRILSNLFIENSPKFLKYGSKKEMRNDLIHLFKNYHGLQAT